MRNFLLGALLGAAVVSAAFGGIELALFLGLAYILIALATEEDERRAEARRRNRH